MNETKSSDAAPRGRRPAPSSDSAAHFSWGEQHRGCDPRPSAPVRAQPPVPVPGLPTHSRQALASGSRPRRSNPTWANRRKIVALCSSPASHASVAGRSPDQNGSDGALISRKAPHRDPGSGAELVVAHATKFRDRRGVDVKRPHVLMHLLGPRSAEEDARDTRARQRERDREGGRCRRRLHSEIR